MTLDFGVVAYGVDEEKEIIINENTNEELLIVKKRQFFLNEKSIEIKRWPRRKIHKKSD